MAANPLQSKTLNTRRILALKLRLNRESLSAIQNVTQLSHPTIINAYKMLLAGGW